MSKPLIVIARIQAKKGKTAQLKKELLRLLKPTRAEAGCISYDLHQSNEDPSLFVFYEAWTNQAALNAHFETPHLKAVRASAPKLARGATDITKWTKLK